jgi:hypothetical protein
MKNLQVTINFEKNTAGLQTQRLLKLDLIAFFSNLSGSILGILGMVGYVMGLFEQKVEKIKGNFSKCYNLNRILHTRDKLFYQNFDRNIRLEHSKMKRDKMPSKPLDMLLEESQIEIGNQDQLDDAKNYSSLDIGFTKTSINKNLSRIVPLDSIIYL